MPRPVWSGTISFGLVTMPVTMSPVVRDREGFHLLHSTDHARLERRMVCPAHNREVAPKDMVRGFEIDPGKYVVVTGEELDSLAPERSRNIEITDFVDYSEINRLHFGRPYYLSPAGADKPYRLLAVALAEKKKAGTAKFVMRGHEYLAALVSVEGAMCLFTLHYASDLANGSELVPGTRPAAREILAAQNLMVRMKESFKPERYENERRKRVQAMVSRLRKKEGAVVAPAAPEAEEEISSTDLMSALEESLSRARARKAGSRG